MRIPIRDLGFLGAIAAGAAVVIGGMVRPMIRASALPNSARAVVDRCPEDIVRRVDAAFRRQWTSEGLAPAGRAPELAIVRRISLALCGTIPSLEEIRRLEALPEGRRADAWLDEILRDRRSADYLAERFARVLVGTEDGPFLKFRRRRFVTWLSDAILANRPYDAIVRDLIAGQGVWTDHPSTNFISVTFDPEKKTYDPERLAARVARGFLGVRIDCAQCHDHPFQPWKRADFRGISAYFGQVEHTLTGISDRSGEFFVDDKKDGTRVAIEPRVPFLPELDPKTGTRRERLARWVTDPRNDHFSKSTVNRAWALMFGRPLVEPIDDIPSGGDQPEPLKILADDFAANGFDLRRLLRSIARTEAFAIDSTSDDSTPSIETREAAWAVFPMTRLRPEQVAGALLQSSKNETIDSNSHILIRLATYGGVNEFVVRHGDPGEEEFNLEASSTIPQRLLMMNGELVEKNINGELGNASTRIAILAPDDRKAVEVAYLVTLTRRPTAEERTHFEARIAGTRGEDRKERLADLIWTLLNSTEFSWDH